MNKLKFLLNRNEEKEKRQMYYKKNKYRWIKYKKTRDQKILDLRPAIIFG